MKKQGVGQLTMLNDYVELMSFPSLITRTTTISEDMQKAKVKKEKKIEQTMGNALNTYWPSLQNHLDQVHVIRDLNMSESWPNIIAIQGQVSMCNSNSFYFKGNMKSSQKNSKCDGNFSCKQESGWRFLRPKKFIVWRKNMCHIW